LLSHLPQVARIVKSALLISSQNSQGSSAYHGHYTVDILDAKSGFSFSYNQGFLFCAVPTHAGIWCRYDDSVVKPLGTALPGPHPPHNL
jgi:hypothetical protein